MHFTSATMANLAVTGEGPIYRLVGKYAVYADEDLDSWAQSRITPPKRKVSVDLVDEIAPSDVGIDRADQAATHDTLHATSR
jgi:hypothetical protein